MTLLVLTAMLFCHIIDDYVLQGWLATGKQRDWWKTNAPDRLYKYDYIMALAEHAFSWTCAIHIPVLVYAYLFQDFKAVYIYVIVFILNWIIHAATDHCKANLHIINLIQDQTIHVAQIIVTWLIYIL